MGERFRSGPHRRKGYSRRASVGNWKSGGHAAGDRLRDRIRQGHLFGRKGDKTYLTIAYTRKGVEKNRSIWSGKSSKSKQFAAAVLNAASNVAMLQGRPETKRFCSQVPAAARFCALIEKSISFQDNLGSK